MRARVSMTTMRRVASLEMTRQARHDATVAAWGPRLSIDEWEQRALPSQEALIAFTREVFGIDTAGQVQHTGRDPMDVTRNYKPSSTSAGIVVKDVPPALDTAPQRIRVKGGYYR